MPGGVPEPVPSVEEVGLALLRFICASRHLGHAQVGNSFGYITLDDEDRAERFVRDVVLSCGRDGSLGKLAEQWDLDGVAEHVSGAFWTMVLVEPARWLVGPAAFQPGHSDLDAYEVRHLGLANSR